MKLTKDDLEVMMKDEFALKSDFIEQILKNQEDANFIQSLIKEYEDGLSTELLKQWKEDAEKYDKHMRDQHSCGTGEIEYQRVFEIVERLKKRIEEIKGYEIIEKDWNIAIEELEKILDTPSQKE